ncbi:hypothetical protein [Arthrobacter mobilis]|uniref:Uncharacterized protein n=1 Tax=Arthrobacter mobilis TaxID=2724944 RepID=A0A7X6HEG9_9MICC|nr:hypothetical protein [Arthrobacter mobilis]NKX55648.1 hypothetical protein [Arthrobacter mobilis]
MSASPAAGCWQPVLFRAVVAAAFGALSIFWQEPAQGTAPLAIGAFLLLTAAAVWLLARRPALAPQRPLLAAAAGVQAAAGVLVPLFPAACAWLAAAALVLSGTAELLLWWRNRSRTAAAGALARDWLVTGAAAAGAGLALPFLAPLGAHALLGVVGGAAIITAVVLLIAALSYRHDEAAARAA